MISVKICGLTSEEAVRATIAAGADYAGFVHFPKSPRHITFLHAAELKALLPASIHSVSVMVNPDDDTIEQMHLVLNPAYLQLHGHESSERVRAIKQKFPAVKIIKAISVRSSDDVAAARHYYDCADMLMFDAGAATQPDDRGQMLDVREALSSNIHHLSSGATRPGGNGLTFDWALLKGREFALPWFLSGGLNAGNVAEAIRRTGAKMVDVSSGVESAPGVKDPALIEAFVKAART